MNYKIQNTFSKSQEDELRDLYSDYFKNGYDQNITGNACTGDEVVFAEAVFSGNYPKAKFSHFDMICGKIIKDSYGAKKQQHTFSIELENGSILRRKGRNVYKYLTLSKYREPEQRNEALNNKYERGAIARAEREGRRRLHSYDINDECFILE